MVNKEERLIKLIRREQSGKGGNYEEICELLFDEINNLVRPVCSDADESGKKVKKLFVRMLQQIDEIDTNDDIHLWIAGFTTVTLYEILYKENGKIINYNPANKEYTYQHIDEDNEFKSKITDYNDALANPKRYMYAKDFFRKLTKGQIILFEMFCYEGFTIDEIEELLEIKKKYITSELAAIRAIVFGNGDEEIELISQDDAEPVVKEAKKADTGNDNDDIAAIRAAVEAIVNNTVDEINTESDGYKDIVSVVNAIKAEPDYDSSKDKLGATLVNINKEHINNAINGRNKTETDQASKDRDVLEVLSYDEDDADGISESKAAKDVVNGSIKKSLDIEADFIDEEDDNANVTDKKKGLAGLFKFEDLSEDDDDDDFDKVNTKTVKKHQTYDDSSDNNNKLLKILSVAIPSVAVVIFIVILLTSGAFKKKSSASGNMVTIAETKTAANKQEKTTQVTTAETKTTEKETTAKSNEKTTAAVNESNNKNTTAAQQNNQQANTQATTQAAQPTQVSTQATEAPTEATTQATEAPTQALTEATTQATEAPTQATESNTQTTEGNTQATAAPTETPTEATAAPTQADTVVDEKNGTALH